MVFASICGHASSAFILRARAVINFLMWAASTLEITNGEQRALRKFSASWNLSLLKRCFTPSNLADTFKTGPCYLGLNSGRSVSINVSKTRKHFSRNIHGARMFPQCSQFPVRETLCFQCQFLFSRCKLCLRYTAGNFNENPNMRAPAKILRAQASENSSNFCQQLEQRPNFASTFKLDGTIRYP